MIEVESTDVLFSVVSFTVEVDSRAATVVNKDELGEVEVFDVVDFATVELDFTDVDRTDVVKGT